VKTIGRKEVVSFPDIDLKDMQAKIDTGAYTSSIHCSKIAANDDNTVTCVFLDDSYKAYTGEAFTFPILKEVSVKSSNGTAEKRYVIVTRMEIFGEMHEIQLTLTDRRDMRVAVLLGRKFLAGKFIVDVRRKNQTN